MPPVPQPAFLKKDDEINDEGSFREGLNSDFDTLSPESQEQVVLKLEGDNSTLAGVGFISDDAKQRALLKSYQKSIIAKKFEELPDDQFEKKIQVIEKNNIKGDDAVDAMKSLMRGDMITEKSRFKQAFDVIKSSVTKDVPDLDPGVLKRQEKVLENKFTEINTLRRNRELLTSMMDMQIDDEAKQRNVLKFKEGFEEGEWQKLISDKVDDSRLKDQAEILGNALQKIGILTDAPEPGVLRSVINALTKEQTIFSAAPLAVGAAILAKGDVKNNKRLQQVAKSIEEMRSKPWNHALSFPVDAIDFSADFSKHLARGPLNPYEFNPNTGETSFSPAKAATLFNATLATTVLGFGATMLVPSSAVGTSLVKIGRSTKQALVGAKTTKGKVAFKSMKQMKLAATDLHQSYLDDMAKFKKMRPGVPVTDDVLALQDDVNISGLFNDEFVEVNGTQARMFNTMKKHQQKSVRAGEINNEVEVLNGRLRSGLADNQETGFMVGRIEELQDEFITLSKKPIFKNIPTENTGFKVLQRTGTEYLTPKGRNAFTDNMAKVRKTHGVSDDVYKESLALEAERLTAIQAIDDPKLIDKGGVTLFGVKVPATEFLNKKINQLTTSKFNILSRFPGVSSDVAHRFNQFIREEKGRNIQNFERIDALTKGMSQEDLIRVNLAIDSNKVNALGETLNGRAKVIKKDLDDLWNTEKAEGLQDKFRTDYVPLIVNNKKGAEKLRIEQFKVGTDLRFAKERKLTGVVGALKTGQSAENIAKIDNLVDNVVKNIDVKGSIKELRELGQGGSFKLDPELDLHKTLSARYMASSNAVSRKRFNVELAREFGVPTTMQQYMAESSNLITSKSDKVLKGVKEFEGKLIPKDVKRALTELDELSVKQRAFNAFLDKDVGSSASRGLAATAFFGLHSMDKLHTFFKGSVTSLFPKFHIRNVVGNTMMNFADIGAETLNFSSQLKASKMLGGNASDVLLKNKFGQTMSGDMFLEQFTKYGGKVSFGDMIDAAGSKSFAQSMYGTASSLLTPSRKFATGAENHARLVNSIAHWKQGYSISEATGRTAKALIDYGNLSFAEREVMNRVIPFYSFFKGNFVNIMDALVKNPKRLFAPLNITARSQGFRAGEEEPFFPGDIGFEAEQKFVVRDVALKNGEFVPSKGNVLALPREPSEMELVKIQEADGRFDTVQRKLSSVGSVFEDVDRFLKFQQDVWMGFKHLDQKHFGKAVKDLANNVYATYRIPLALLDVEVAGIKLTKPRRIPDVLAKYMLEIPNNIKQMVGLTFEERNGKVIGQLSPAANNIFTMMGGSRFMSSFNQDFNDMRSTVDNVMKLLGPLSTRTVSVNDAELFDKKLKQRKLKGFDRELKKAIKNVQEEKQNKILFQRRIPK